MVASTTASASLKTSRSLSLTTSRCTTPTSMWTPTLISTRIKKRRIPLLRPAKEISRAPWVPMVKVLMEKRPSKVKQAKKRKKRKNR